MSEKKRLDVVGKARRRVDGRAVKLVALRDGEPVEVTVSWSEK